MKYFVRIKRDLPNKPNSTLKFGPIGSITEAKVIANHESREPKTHWVKVVDEKGAVRFDVTPHDTYSKNPAKRKGTKNPRRVSQITKKPPSKRLVARRKANTEQGYFPNPKGKRERAEFPFVVQEQAPAGNWFDILGTKDKKRAFEFAKYNADTKQKATRVILREETEI